jgi:hypothetical protein
MYSNSFSRLAYLIKIEWGKKWKNLIGSALIYMVVILVAIMNPAQKLLIAIDFFIIHFVVGLTLVFATQLFLLFPEWSTPFKTIQLLQLPAKPVEKYLAKLCFPFFFAPVVFTLIFLVFRPIFLQACLAAKGFMPYPLYQADINGMIKVALIVPLFAGGLFVPGALIFKRLHLLFSFLLCLLLFVLAGLTAQAFQLPAYVTASPSDQSIFGAMEAQLFSVVYFFQFKPLHTTLLWCGGIIPIMLYSGYFLFKQREI